MTPLLAAAAGPRRRRRRMFLTHGAHLRASRPVVRDGSDSADCDLDDLLREDPSSKLVAREDPWAKLPIRERCSVPRTDSPPVSPV